MSLMSLIAFAISALAAAALAFRARPAGACTTVLVGKEASRTGRVIVGHNEDSGGRYVMRTHLVPPLRRGAGQKARFEPSCAELPLPEERARLLWSEARPYIADGGASFCDFFVNGNGVVVCSNNCTASREDRPDLTDGGAGYGIRRLAAEGARSAAHAVEIATSLVDRFGYASSGRSYHFADRDEIWVMQIVNGKHYAVKRVPDDEVYLNPNHYTIHQPDPGAPGAAELEEYARARGWYDPATGPFSFARAYQAAGSWKNPRNVHRHVRGLEILMGRDMRELLAPGAELPFSVKPAEKVGVDTVKRILRSHFEGTSSDVSGGESPHFMATRPICASSTLESTIAEIRDDADGILLRRALGRPCLSPYMPWYFGVTRTPDGYCAPAQDPEEALATHFSVPASDMDFDAGSAWFRCVSLQTAADALCPSGAGDARARVMELEDRMERELAGLDPRVMELLGTDRDGARAMMDEAVERWAGAVMKGVSDIREGLDVLEGEPLGELDVSKPGEPFSVRLPLPVDPDLEQCFCGPFNVMPERCSRGLRAGEGGAVIVFSGGEWLNRAAPCRMDLTMRIVDRQGRRYAGRVLIRVRVGSASPDSPDQRGQDACDLA